MTVQHDFNQVKKEWINKFDIVYSNSIDHAFNIAKTITIWSNQLNKNGNISANVTVKGDAFATGTVGGKIAAVIKEPMPPRGHWVERSPGIYDGGGDLDMTLDEWDCPIIRLDADSKNLYSGVLPSDFSIEDIGFILGDDKPIECERGIPRSLGSSWLQGHTCISIVHFLLDEGIELQL